MFVHLCRGRLNNYAGARVRSWIMVSTKSFHLLPGQSINVISLLGAYEWKSGFTIPLTSGDNGGVTGLKRIRSRNADEMSYGHCERLSERQRYKGS